MECLAFFSTNRRSPSEALPCHVISTRRWLGKLYRQMLRMLPLGREFIFFFLCVVYDRERPSDEPAATGHRT